MGGSNRKLFMMIFFVNNNTSSSSYGYYYNGCVCRLTMYYQECVSLGKFYKTEVKYFWCGLKEKPHDPKEEPCGFVGTNSEVEFIANDKRMIGFHHRLKNMFMTQISGDDVEKLRDVWEKRQRQKRPEYSDITDPLSLATKVPLPLDVFPVTKSTLKTPSYESVGNQTPHHYIDNQSPMRKPSYDAQGNRTPNRSTSIPAPSHCVHHQELQPPQGPPVRHQDIGQQDPQVQAANGWVHPSDPRLQRLNDPRSQPRSRTPDECWREPQHFTPPAPNRQILANDARSSTSLGFRSQQPRATNTPNEHRDQLRQNVPAAPDRQILANDVRSSTSFGFHAQQSNEPRFADRIIAHQTRIAPESDHQGTRVYNNTPIHRPHHSPELAAPVSPTSASQVRMAPSKQSGHQLQNQNPVHSPTTVPGYAAAEVRSSPPASLKAPSNQDPRVFNNSQVHRPNQKQAHSPELSKPATPNVPPQRVSPPAPIKESSRTIILSDSVIKRLNEIRQKQVQQNFLDSNDLSPGYNDEQDLQQDLQFDVSNQYLPRVHKTQNHPKEAGERQDVREEGTSTPKPSELPQDAVKDTDFSPAPAAPIGPNHESQQPTNPLGFLPWNDLPNLRKFIPDFLGKPSEDISLPSPSPSELLPPPPPPPVLSHIAVKISTTEASTDSSPALPTPEPASTPARLAPMHFKGSSGRKIAKSKIAVFNSPSPIKEASKDQKNQKNRSQEASLPAPDRPPGILAAGKSVPEKVENRQTPSLISSVFDYLPHLEASAASAQSFRNSCTSSSRSPSPSPDRKRRHLDDSDGKKETRRRSRSRSRHQETGRDSSNEQGWSATPRAPKKLRRESVDLVHGSTSGSDMDIESDGNPSPEILHQGKIDSSVFMTYGREPRNTVRLISLIDLVDVPDHQARSDPSGESNPAKPPASQTRSTPHQQLVSLVDQVEVLQYGSSGQRTGTVSNARLPPASFVNSPAFKYPNQPPSGGSGLIGTSETPNPSSQRNLYQKLSCPDFGNLKGADPEVILAQYRDWMKNKKQATSSRI
ncbi:Protein CBG26126 [Caenorhabditis briggsae]|uniref:Protein CBG26126 n=1 Tax=Caenorhabditis briggsae TaxID=6238 RepID=B6IFH3_CAEBR|nr:Protein CBG26126 [Caenorhabditis briggsae]CAR98653.1 Protein CBG26126 [Caenorhabditis briggsae]